MFVQPQTVLRIWDCLLYEGSKVILRVALTLLSLHKEKLLACHDFAQLCTAMKVCSTISFFHFAFGPNNTGEKKESL